MGYIQMAGGCDSIVDLVCDATNMAALKAYEAQASTDQSIQDALDCVRKRCGVVADVTRLNDAQMPAIAPPHLRSGTGSMNLVALAGVGLAAIVGAALVRHQRMVQVSSAE